MRTAVEDYLRALNVPYKTGVATEHSYRGALQDLLTALLPGVVAAARPQRITSPSRLATLMAGKARLLSQGVRRYLSDESNADSTLAQQMEAFREVLIHDIDVGSFADIFAQHYIDKNGEGVVAFVNNNGFLGNPTFRGMRWSLLQSFDDIYILNLHGNAKKKEVCPDGSKDENVFDIMQGVSINIFVKRKGTTDYTDYTDCANSKIRGIREIRGSRKSLATVHYADLYGLREDKYAFLDANGIESVKWQTLDLQEPYYFFVPKDFALQEEYEKGFSIAELMNEQSMGSVSANDDLNVSITEREQRDKINDLLMLQEGDWRQKTGRKKDSRDWTYATARADAAEHGGSVQKISYRPFDNRFTCYTGKSRGLYSSPQQKIMSHFLQGENLGLCALRICSRDDSLPVFVTDKITDKTILSSKDNANVFPLYLYETSEANLVQVKGKVERRPNFDAAIYAKICAVVNDAPCLQASANTVRNDDRLAFYRSHELGKTWYDVADPHEFLSMKPVVVEWVDPKADRHTAKEIFRKMPPVRNAADGRVVRFTVRAAKKLIFHKEISVFGLCASFDRLFAGSVRAWSETAADIPDHRQHPNIDAYHHYIAKAAVGGELYYVRFTVREDERARSGNEFHGTMVTRVIVYNSKGASLSFAWNTQGEPLASLKATGTGRSFRSHTHGESPVPFVDNKIALFLSAVNGAEKSEEGRGKREDVVEPEDVFNYIYGVLHTPGYREKYREFLKIDFPRIPYPESAAVFRRVASLGAKLVAVHLLKDPEVTDVFRNPYARFAGEGDGVVSQVEFEAGRVHVNGTQCFENVPESAWNFFIGGYRPAQKWLKDRKGRTLSNDDLVHYKSIVAALVRTGELMSELDCGA